MHYFVYLSFSDEGLDVTRCQEALGHFYLQSLCKIPLFPGNKRRFLNMDDIYTNLAILVNIPKPFAPVEIPLESRHEIFTRKTDNGIPPTRVLVLGNPGCGKSILAAKLAHDWATKNPDSTLKNARLLFVLNMRWMTPETTLEEAVLQQLLPIDTIVSQSSLRNYIESNQSECVIVFDAYDEYGFSGDFTQKESGVQRILVNDCLRECQVLVTSRFWKAGDFNDLQDVYSHMQISGFSEENVREYVMKFFVQDVEAGEKLLEYLIDHNMNPGIANVPLMTLLMCRLWKESGGENMPSKIGNLFTKIFELLHRQYLAKNTTESINLTELVLKVGQVALTGLWSSSEDTLVFGSKEFVSLTSEETLRDGCRIGLLSVEQKSRGTIVSLLEFEDDTTDRTDLNESVIFFHKSCQEKCAGEYLAHLVRTHLDQLKSNLQCLSSVNTCMRLEMILRFACGASSEAAAMILQRLMEVFKSEMSETFDLYYNISSLDNRRQLDPDVAKSIQKFIELCLQCYFESPSGTSAHEIIEDLFQDGHILFIGMSPYTSSAIGQYISRAKNTKWIRIHAIPTLTGAIGDGTIGDMWEITQKTIKSLLLSENQTVDSSKDAISFMKLCAIEVVKYFKDWQSSRGINLIQIFTSLTDIEGLCSLDLFNVQLGNQVESLLSVIDQGGLESLTNLSVRNQHRN